MNSVEKHQINASIQWIENGGEVLNISIEIDGSKPHKAINVISKCLNSHAELVALLREALPNLKEYTDEAAYDGETSTGQPIIDHWQSKKLSDLIDKITTTLARIAIPERNMDGEKKGDSFAQSGNE